MNTKEKIYKHRKANYINIHPGDLQRLPDDCFYYSFFDIKGEI